MKESKLQQKVLAFCRDCGLMARKVRWEGRRGCPDVVIMGPGGHHLWVELKRPDGTGRLSAWQEREIERMRKLDVSAYVIDDFDEFTELLAYQFPDQCG